MSENDQDTGNLSAHQTKALDCLANGATKEQAAAIANVTLRTINRWIAEDAAFRQALDDVNQAAVDDAINMLSTLLIKANKAIQGILDNAQAKDRDKLRAADMVYNIYVKMRHFDDLEGRVKALEERLENE